MRAIRLFAVSLAGAGLAAAPAAAEEPHRMKIAFSAPPEVTVEADPITGEETFYGAVSGTVETDGAGLFAGASVDCEFDGRTFESRGFSCGFTEAEAVTGVCRFADGNGGAAVAEWRCGTGATMTSDARCEGTARWVEGTGAFAGIAGEARIHSDLFLYPTDGFSLWKGLWRAPRLAALAY